MKICVRKNIAKREAWDLFAQRCDASFRCAYHASNAWQFEFHIFYKLRRLELFAVTPAGEVKIGQCAVGVGTKWRVFADSLQLLPEYRPYWDTAMTAVLDALGSGRYVYGSEWNTELSREDAIRELPNTRVLNVARSSLEVVDFNQWPSWDDYYSSVSNNVRRNVARSRKDGGDQSVSVNRKLSLATIVSLNKHRYMMFLRKNVKRSFALILFRSLFRSFATRDFTEFGFYKKESQVIAQYSGIQFGANAYYLESGALSNNNGASWHLLMTMMERAWEENQGHGYFVMGSDDGSQAGEKAWEGLVRSRQQCRVTSLPISILRFAHNTAD